MWAWVLLLYYEELSCYEGHYNYTSYGHSCGFLCSLVVVCCTKTTVMGLCMTEYNVVLVSVDPVALKVDKHMLTTQQ